MLKTLWGGGSVNTGAEAHGRRSWLDNTIGWGLFVAWRGGDSTSLTSSCPPPLGEKWAHECRKDTGVESLWTHCEGHSGSHYGAKMHFTCLDVDERMRLTEYRITESIIQWTTGLFDQRQAPVFWCFCFCKKKCSDVCWNVAPSLFKFPHRMIRSLRSSKSW